MAHKIAPDPLTYDVRREDTSVEALRAELRKRSEEIEKLLEQNRVLTDQKRHLENVLSGILGSLSWRITSPVRRTREAYRKYTPLLRRARYRFSPVPQVNIESTGSGFTVTGPSAVLGLTRTRGPERLPSGWVTFDAPLESPRGQMYFLLYYRTGPGFTGGERAWVSVEDRPSELPLLRLPEGVLELRLDPFEQEGTFDLGEVTVRELGSLQVAWHLLSRHLRRAVRNPRAAMVKAMKAYAILKQGGFTALRHRLGSDSTTQSYDEWVEKYDTLSERDREQIRSCIEALPTTPLISVVLPVYNPPLEFLRAAIESVLRQTYTRWELCIADDCSTDPNVRGLLEEYRAKDPRIKVTFRTENGHIAKASNSALELATGEYIALLDHDDELTEDALFVVVDALNSNPHADLLYSDEDKKTGYGARFNPHFKSDWNPDLFLSQNYICHLSVYRTSVARAVGGFREGYEGAQDWDLALRVVDAVPEDHIVHIPHILYHWRVIEGSTAQSTSYKPYVMEAQAKAVRDHLARRGERGRVEILRDISQLRVTFEVPDPAPRVTLIIPTKDQVGFLRRCVESIFERTEYRDYDVVVVNNGSTEESTFDYFKEISRDPRVTILDDPREFNFSRLNNFAVSHTNAPLVAFLNNDLEVISPGWLTEMVSFAIRPGVGAVGARLWYPNGLLQHGGIILGIGGVAGHNHKGRLRSDVGYFNRIVLPQNLSAVTAACVVMKRELFLEIGGFDEEEFSVAFNDVDLCLRVRARGERIVYTPYAELFHHESVSRGYENTPQKFMRFEREVENMKRRWGSVLKCDPYYNPNLTLLHEDFSFSFPPRVQKPWRK